MQDGRDSIAQIPRHQDWTSVPCQAISHLSPRAEIWLIVVATGAVNSVWIGLSERFSMSLVSPYSAVGLIALPLVLFRTMRSNSFDRLLDTGYRLALFLVFMAIMHFNLFVFNHLMMSVPLPLADDVLLAWDLALGFDWNAYAKWMSSSPWLSEVMRIAYIQGPIVGTIGIAVTAMLFQRHDRIDELLYLLTSSALVCILIAPVFPAEAPWKTVASPEVKALMGEELWASWRDQFYAVRNGDPVRFGTFPLAGLITFPSYHTCIGLTVMWCSRGHPLALAAGMTVGLSIVAATPVFGGHYFVDLIGGGAVILALILLWHRRLGRFAPS